jgi:hypothetical protein
MECLNATSLRRKSGQWGTQPLLLVQGVGVKAARRDYLEFFMYRQQRLGAPFKPYFGLSGIPQHSLTLAKTPRSASRKYRPLSRLHRIIQ